jgi:putative spermidine/putrescine transport system permease protein
MVALTTELTQPTAPKTSGGRTLGLRARRARRVQALRWLLLLLFALFFVVPLIGLVEFSLRKGTDWSSGHTLQYWRDIGQAPGLVAAIRVSVELAIVTAIVALALLVPTMVWVRLRLPKLARLIEWLCLLPLTIPAIVLVVGWAPIYLWINYFTPTQYQTSPIVLAFAYIILVIPYMYRALDAGLQGIDVQTLTEAARSLGANWTTVMLRVIVPNIGSAVLNASLLGVSLVLGEYTVASLLNYVNVQVAMQQVAQSETGVAQAVASGSLAVVFLLLFALSFVGRRRRGGVEED